MDKVILASASPRRSELFLQVGISHTVEESEIDEVFDESMICHDVVTKLAMDKAITVASRCSDPDTVIIGVDTIVVKRGVIFGKPSGKAEAMEMLKKLRRSTHEVLTGFAIIRVSDGKTVVDYEKTLVTFKDISDEEIRAYVRTREPFDKAGGYAVQGIGAIFVQEIRGDYSNVVGLPVGRIVDWLMREFDIYPNFLQRSKH